MKALDSEKVLEVLRAQQSAIDALNYAATQHSECYCCSSSPAREEIVRMNKAMGNLEKSVEEPS